MQWTVSIVSYYQCVIRIIFNPETLSFVLGTCRTDGYIVSEYHSVSDNVNITVD